MFNLVKWAYNLGVKHERQRIADYLIVQSQYQQRRIDAFNNRLYTESPTPDYAAALEHNVAVRQHVREIVDGIFEPLPYQQNETQSIMFPKEGKDGN